MSHADVYSAVSEHVPCRHMEWENDSAPDLPWALYHGYTQPISADDSQVAARTKWTVELYERRRDKVLEKALGDTLRERFGTVRRSESYVENDNMLEVIYTFYQIEGEYDG
jgi:hypothetical protein